MKLRTRLYASLLLAGVLSAPSIAQAAPSDSRRAYDARRNAWEASHAKQFRQAYEARRSAWTASHAKQFRESYEARRNAWEASHLKQLHGSGTARRSALVRAS